MTAWHLNPRNAQAKYTNYGTVKEVFDFFAQYFSGNDLNTLRAKYLRYKKQRGDFSILSLWEKATINDPEIFWAIISDFSPIFANFTERLLNILPNSVLFERAFSVLKL
jgi:hypothetical protein